MTPATLREISSGQLLAAAERNVATRRRAEVERLLVVLEWCDRHGDDHQARPGAVPVTRGGDRLVDLGGDGTPRVAELCFGELAIAFGSGVISLRNLAADALDLRHRLPRLFAALVDGRCDTWLARKVAAMARPLDRRRVGVVDAAVTAALDESPGRVLAVAEARVIAADPDAHRARIAEDDARTGVWLSRRRAGDAVDDVDAEPSTCRISAKLPQGAAVELDAVIDELADALATHADVGEDDDAPTRSQLRVQALELLSQPHAAARFLDGLAPGADHTGADDTGVATRPRRRRTAVLNIHLSAWALHGDGVARVEELGPVLVSQLEELLRRRDITVRPVVDLNAVQTVAAYEHPTAIRDRVLLRHVGDAFPHSGAGGRVDLDHATPYVAADRSPQTGDGNTAPLTRTHHRIKTHAGMQVDQLGLAAHRWITPHGLARVVTPYGTTKVEPIRARDGTVVGECYPSRYPVALEVETHTWPTFVESPE